jgi:hypothetical protein
VGEGDEVRVVVHDVEWGNRYAASSSSTEIGVVSSTVVEGATDLAKLGSWFSTATSVASQAPESGIESSDGMKFYSISPSPHIRVLPGKRILEDRLQSARQDLTRIIIREPGAFAVLQL